MLLYNRLWRYANILGNSSKQLRLLDSGPIPPNPCELLGRAKMKKLIEYARAHADYVIIDSPPTVAVTDASVLKSKVDGAVLVISAVLACPEMVQRAKEL